MAVDKHSQLISQGILHFLQVEGRESTVPEDSNSRRRWENKWPSIPPSLS